MHGVDVTLRRHGWARWLALGATALGATALSGGTAGAAAAARHSGALTARGIGAFSHSLASGGGQSYGAVSTTGTLSGFVPGRTYYVYDNNPSPEASPRVSAPVTADRRGDIVLTAKNLGLDGPNTECFCFQYSGDSRHQRDATDLGYYISTDATSTSVPPDRIVYSPPTTLLPNPSDNPWVAQGGTWLGNSGPNALINHEGTSGPEYSFGETQTGDGNFCLFDADSPIWCTHTLGSKNTMWMQRDGNLVVYNGSGQALWQSRTSGHPGAHLVLQEDRNLVIYSAKGVALWQSHTYR